MEETSVEITQEALDKAINTISITKWEYHFGTASFMHYSLAELEGYERSIQDAIRLKKEIKVGE